ncbi:MAG: hypothetical protein ACI9IO_002224, partial [Cyanobium sp.]
LSTAGALRCRIKPSPPPLLSPAPDQDAIGERRARKLSFFGGQTIGPMAAP